MKRKVLLSCFALFLGMFAFFSTSCQREADSVVAVFIEDSLGTPVPDAVVRLFSDGGGVDVQKETLSDGTAEFSFDIEAILFIEVTKAPYGTVDGGFVRLEEGETYEKTVVLE
mgnify:CR=1 FL=1